MTRRCATCGVGTVTGDDVRRCDGCAFDYCDQHAATVGGVTTCEECRRLDKFESAVAERLYESCRTAENARREGRISTQVCSWADATVGVRLQWRDYARATLAWTESKVREAARMARQEYAPGADNDAHAIQQTATRVMKEAARD